MTSLKQSQTEHTWIHFMLVFTLLSTAIHFGLVMYCVASWPVAHWGKEAYQRLHTSEQNGTFNKDRSTIMLASRFRWEHTLLFITAIA